MRRTELRGDDEAHLALLELFVGGERRQDRVAGEIARQVRRQLEALESGDHALSFRFRKARFTNGDFTSRRDPETDRLTVEEAAVFSCSFDGVADGVAEV